jgi:hypothetical protein
MVTMKALLQEVSLPVIQRVAVEDTMTNQVAMMGWMAVQVNAAMLTMKSLLYEIWTAQPTAREDMTNQMTTGWMVAQEKLTRNEPVLVLPMTAVLSHDEEDTRARTASTMKAK